MSVRLRVAGAEWRAHQRRLAAETPGLVPVAKGNGYGFGLGLLAGEAQSLGADTLAVGTGLEVGAVGAFTGQLVVLQPWRAYEPGADQLLADPRVVHTVSRVEDLRRLVASGRRPRVLLELLTSMRRHGLQLAELGEVRQLLSEDRVEVVGWTVHLPMPGAADGNLAEAQRLASAAVAVRPVPVWFSHVTPAEYAQLRQTVPTGTRMRVGTRLWLGGSGLYQTTATVLDCHPVRRGEKVGYWQRTVPVDGHVVVVSGGTAHGIALEAPTAAANPRQRVISAVTGSMEAVGLARSPFTVGGKKRWFVEPPHMQSSMVFLPGSQPPEPGEEVPVELRLTTASVDEVLVSQ
ncbi:MAG: alanine racemase [Actinomycetia bacterium]|nr:alanine racemase [Actinomycetes bacterium]